MQNSSTAIKSEISDIYNGRNGTPVNVAKEYTRLYIKAVKVFGSWRRAVEACGIDYERARNNKKWNRNKIIARIKELNAEGNSLRPWILRKNGYVKLLSAANYHFGSWKKAVEAASLDYGTGRKRAK